VLAYTGETPDVWDVTDDGHTWTLFWAPVGDLPPIIPPQDQCLAYLSAALTS
jgi:hypothetical protein